MITPKPKQTLKLLIQTGEVCRCLRAKALFYDVGDLSSEIEENPYYTMYSGMSGPFWCGQTQGLQGPDGKIASIENCHGACGRTCCETA